MTEDEAGMVATICIQADGGCDNCGMELFDMLQEEFPEHRELWRDYWLRAKGTPLYDYGSDTPA